ncbi:MAG: alginate O-acetyltransferase [Verrucomicrobiaceae bacterium]|nr:alginate O-acetyltransferase [Verrucomicrobiaceae bacterium]
MLFNSLACVVFLLVFWPVYWLGKSPRWRHGMLIAGSLFFYGWWDSRFVPLMVGVSVVAWAGARLHELAILAGRSGWARSILATFIALPLLGLAFFKYTIFLAGGVLGMAEYVGLHLETPVWHIALPVGISFYCFHGISYVVDTAKGKVPVEKAFSRVLIYIAFFPQLVAGPIVRSTVFLPQLTRDRVFVAAKLWRACERCWRACS